MNGIGAKLARFEEPVTADDGHGRGHQRLSAKARQRAEPFARGDIQTRIARAADNGAADGMFGTRLKRCGHREHVLCAGAVDAEDIRDGHATVGQGAGLVEGHAADRGQAFEAGAALDEHTGARGDRQGRHHGHGRRDHQRAGTRDHKQYQGSIRPGAPLTARKRQRFHRPDHRRHHGDQHGQRDYGGRVPASEGLHQRLGWRALSLRLLHHVDDAGDGAVLRQARDSHVE